MEQEIAMMVFSVIMTLIVFGSIVGTILLYPLVKRLGGYLEAKSEEARALAGRSPEDLERLFSSLESFGRRLKELEERQEFTEKLLARPKSGDQG